MADIVYAPLEKPTIEVSYSSDVLGSGVFWVGPPSLIPRIRNVVAKQCAEETARTGERCDMGMWSARIIDPDAEIVTEDMEVEA